jgi:hypothetical protein
MMQVRSLGAFDVVVVGGGPGGVAAAVSAARKGASTILLEREGCLGGGMTTMMVVPFMPHAARRDAEGKEPRMVVNAGFFAEVVERLKARGAAFERHSTPFDDEAAKVVLDEMAAEAGVTVVFHAALFDVAAGGARVERACFAHNGGPLEVAGKVFIDSTGDALLAAAAGADVQFGNEQGHVMPMTTNFVVGGVDLDRMPEWKDFKAMCLGGGQDTPALLNTNMSCSWGRPDRGWVHFNAIRVGGSTIDPLDLSKAEAEGRQRIENWIQWARTNVSGYENAYLVKSASHIGIRESRRIVGDYMLTYEDWKDCRTFDDGIACCSYDIDVHGHAQGQVRIEHLPPMGFYQVPYRCLTPKGLENLLVASRSISATVEAHSSLRIMPPVMNIGQAAGMAAAMSLPGGDVRGIDVQALRQHIRDAGGVLEPK